ncbi:MAG: trypsin-like peptidase domain-containing protein [Pseudanabaenaceae cyanobacterium]
MIHHTKTIGAIALFGLSGALWGLPVVAQDREEQTNIDVYARTSAAVVSLRSPAGVGSGTVIDREGGVLTSAHVVRGQTRIEVILANGQRVWGRTIATNRSVDLALLQLEELPTPLPALEFAPFAEVRVGQRAFAIGNPFGRFAGTLTTGIVSRIDRAQNRIQTDAAIAPGNSGGPLLDSQGRILGINTAVFRGAGQRGSIGFAIASDTARQFVMAARAGRIGLEAATETGGRLVFNEAPVTHQFTLADNRLPDGSFFQVFRFEGKQGQRIVIDMESEEIDPYLVLFDPQGQKIAEDDNSGTGDNARIVLTLPSTGTYTLYANSYTVGDTGRFRLQARTANP